MLLPGKLALVTIDKFLHTSSKDGFLVHARVEVDWQHRHSCISELVLLHAIGGRWSRDPWGWAPMSGIYLPPRLH